MGFDKGKTLVQGGSTLRLNATMGNCRICGISTEPKFGATMMARIPMGTYVQPMKAHVTCAEQKGALNG